MKGRFAGYLLAYLGCTVLSVVFALAGAYEEVQKAEEGTARPFGALLQALIFALVLGLFSIPIRLLLGLFPEPSRSSVVRLVRRSLLGAVVGPIPALVVFLVGDHDAKLGELIVIAMGFGLTVGVMDTIVRDGALGDERVGSDLEE